ncbi:MAG: hypothetical protein ACFBSD_10115 [Paracoccaceae bacterium]
MPIAWQVLPGLRGERSTLALATPEGAVRADAIPVFAPGSGVADLVRIGTARPADGGYAVGLFDGAPVAPDLGTALHLPRDLRLVWLGRRGEIGGQIESGLDRFGGAVRDLTSEIAGHPHFAAAYLPRLQRGLDRLARAAEDPDARRAAADAARRLVAERHLPALRIVLRDAVTEVVTHRLEGWWDGIAGVFVNTGPPKIDPGGVIDVALADPRTKATARRMLGDFARDAAVSGYGAGLAGRLAVLMPQDPEMRRLAREITDDPAFAPAFARFASEIEGTVRSLAAALFLTEDGGAVHPLAAVALRGLIRPDDPGVLLLSAEDAPLAAALAPRAWARYPVVPAP